MSLATIEAISLSNLVKSRNEVAARIRARIRPKQLALSAEDSHGSWIGRDCDHGPQLPPVMAVLVPRIGRTCYPAEAGPIPGIGDEIDGAMQPTPQWERQSMS